MVLMFYLALAWTISNKFAAILWIIRSVTRLFRMAFLAVCRYWIIWFLKTFKLKLVVHVLQFQNKFFSKVTVKEKSLFKIHSRKMQIISRNVLLCKKVRSDIDDCFIKSWHLFIAIAFLYMISVSLGAIPHIFFRKMKTKFCMVTRGCKEEFTPDFITILNWEVNIRSIQEY